MLVFWTLRRADQKYLECFKMWCWRKMEKNSLAGRVTNEEVYIESRMRGIFHKQ